MDRGCPRQTQSRWLPLVAACLEKGFPHYQGPGSPLPHHCSLPASLNRAVNTKFNFAAIGDEDKKPFLCHSWGDNKLIFFILLRSFGSGLPYHACSQTGANKLPTHIYCCKKSLWIHSDSSYWSGVKSSNYRIQEFFHTVFSTGKARCCAKQYYRIIIDTTERTIEITIFIYMPIDF